MLGKSLKVTEPQKQPELQAGGTSSQRGWRSVFGQARREEVEPVDEAVAKELERIDPGEWQ
jgi:hypothetical protein